MLIGLAATGCGSVRTVDDGDDDGSPGPDGSLGGDLDGGPTEGDSGLDPPEPKTWFANATDGDDANEGTAPEAPFRTITRALGLAGQGDTIQVAPGTYDAALGETFPIAVPAGVTLRGDEATKGADVVVVGDGPSGQPGAVVVPGVGSTLAGLTIRAASSGSELDVAVYLDASGVTIENCTLADGPSYGIFVQDGIGQLIRGNLLLRNRIAGLFFGGGGFAAQVEGNVIRENGIGVGYESPGGDLGGGLGDSAGGNVISCNTDADLYTTLDDSESITAAGCAWDHVPPTVSSGSGGDILNQNGAVLVLADAIQAERACP